MVAPTEKNQPSFEEALEKLRRLVSQLETGELGLEDSIEKYKKGRELGEYCESKLKKAEETLLKISKDPQGELSAKPFAKEDSSPGSDS